MAKRKATRTTPKAQSTTAKQAAHGEGNAVSGSAVASAPVNQKPQIPAAGAIASAPVMEDLKKR